MRNTPNIQSLPESVPPHSSKRPLLRLAALLSALALSGASAVAATNSLANPGFETGAFSPWVDSYNPSHSVDSTNGWVYTSGNTVHEPAHSGAYALKTWGTWWGSFVQTHTVSQYIPAAADSVWSADVWAVTVAPDNIKNNNYAQLQVTFLDASSNLLSAVGYSGVLDTNVPSGTWLHLVATNVMDGSTNLVAPYGTAFVRYGLFFSQDAAQSGGSIYWDDATLLKTASSDPEISASPKDQTVIYGQTATFTVLASGTAPLTYQWQKDWVDLPGATNATLVLTNVTSDAQATYAVTVQNGKGSVLNSGSGYLTVLNPGILTNPASVSKIESETATFTVAAAGSGTLTYEWYKDGQLLSDGGRISGADTATLTISGLTQADSGSYTAKVTGAGVATSAAATLYVKALAQVSNLIRDGGFESGLTYWGNWNGRGAVTAPPGAGETNYNGSRICELWGTGNGTWNGVNQSFTPIPGALYTASAWALHSTGALITGSSEAWLEVNFYNNGNAIASYSSAHITSNSVAGVWTNLVVAGVTPPANANEVRCQLNYHAGDNGGAVFFDEVSFWVRVPVTATAAADASGNCQLSFPAQPGVNYQILYKDDLSDSSWQLLRTVTADLSGQVKITEGAGAAKKFYRINALWNN